MTRSSRIIREKQKATRHRELLDEPYIRRTQGMVAQPFLRPALLRGIEVIKELLDASR